MSFLTLPYLWLGVAAAAVPIIIHLILRSRAEIVHFAALRFLMATPKELLRRRKLKQILLLAMRIVALLLLGLAFARPLLVNKKLEGIIGPNPAAIAIVIDASASMAAAGNFETARTQADEIIRNAGAEDRITIIAAGATSLVLAEEAEPAAALQALKSLRQQQSSGRLNEAIQFADNFLQRSVRQRRLLYVLSDFQASNVAPGNLALNSFAQFHPIAVTSGWNNVAILGGQRNQTDGQTQFFCRVRNFSDQDQEVEVRLTGEDGRRKLAASRRLTLAAQTEQTVQFSEAEAGGRRTVELPMTFECLAGSDELELDNRYYLAPVAATRRRLLLVDGNDEAGFFARQALELPGSEFRVVTTTQLAIEQINFDDFEAVVFAGASGLNREAARRLLRYVDQGGGLIIALSDRLPVETVNHTWMELLPGKIISSVNASHPGRGEWRLTEIDFAHPVFKVFSDPANGDPSAIKLTSYYEVEPQPDASVIAGLDNGAAALLEVTVGKGKVLLWASTFNLASGNFPVKSIFVPLLHQMVGYVRRSQPPVTNAVVDRPLYVGDELDLQKPVAVTLPDGSKQEWRVPSPTFQITPLAGHYRFTQNGRSVWQSVNLEARESDPAALAVEDVRARFSGGEQTQLSGFFESGSLEWREQEKYQKLWRAVMWGLLILLLVEPWLANRTPR